MVDGSFEEMAIAGLDRVLMCIALISSFFSHFPLLFVISSLPFLFIWLSRLHNIPFQASFLVHSDTLYSNGCIIALGVSICVNFPIS